MRPEPTKLFLTTCGDCGHVISALSAQSLFEQIQDHQAHERQRPTEAP